MASGESHLIARLLSGSMAIVLRRLGLRSSKEEEIQVLLKEGIQAGIFGEAEHEIVTRVFRLGAPRANQRMPPMKRMVWLALPAPPGAMRRKITESPHSRFP